MKIKVKRRSTALLAALILMGLLGGCAIPGAPPPAGGNAPTAGSATGDGGSAKVLRLYQTVEPPTLDPSKCNAVPSATVLFHLYEGLLRNNNGEIIPGIATDYALSEDGLTYTFQLRDNAKWSDGEPVTADQFVYAFQRLMDPNTAATMAYMGEAIKNGQACLAGKLPVDQLGVAAPDDHTLVVTLERPCSYFPTMISGPLFAPLRKDIVEKHGQAFAADVDNAVYNGPFLLGSWAHDSRLTLEKNPNYWDKDAIKLDSVELNILTDANTPLGMYETGDLDYVDVPSALAPQYADKTTLYHNGAMEYVQINLACGNPALANQNFRLALSYGINREECSLLSRNGLPLATSRLVLPAMQGHKGTFAEDYPAEPFPLTGDAAKAKEYLDKAMQELGVSDPAQIQFTLNYSESESVRKIVEVIQAQWKKNLGVEVTLSPMPYAVLYTNQSAGDFEMMFGSWVPDYDDPMAYLEIFSTDNGYNFSQHNNPAYDAALAAAQATSDPKERMDYLAEAEKIVCMDAPMIVLSADRRAGMWDQSRVLNFQPYYVGVQFNFMYTDLAS